VDAGGNDMGVQGMKMARTGAEGKVCVGDDATGPS